jgi:hypothetical protein
MRRFLQCLFGGHYRIAACLMQSVQGRANVPEIPRVDDHFYVRIGFRNLFENLYRPIAGVIIDEDVLIAITSYPRHYGPDAVI